MKVSKQLRKPENWQDFEKLCKKLWGEIWKCPEVKMNGRSGQSQNGVDIYGIPYGEQEYYGIQCKGKDDYSKAELTEKEIDREAELAKAFEPPLKKLYFATTANKDVKIESYIRKKNIENKKTGLFEVHIYSWEDIVDLIDENRQTHDYYINSQNFKTEHEIAFLFEDDKAELIVEVPFKKTITHRELPDTVKLSAVGYSDHLRSQIDKLKLLTNHDFARPSVFSTNQSYCTFYFRLHNLGTEPLRDFKIFLKFDGDFVSVERCSKSHPLLKMPEFNYDTSIWNEDKRGQITPLENILVQDDTIAFDDICIKPINDRETEVNIHWKLVSLNYKEEGDLKLIIRPTYWLTTNLITVSDPNEVGTTEEIEDLITRN